MCKRWASAILALLVTAILLSSFSGCGGGGSQTTPPPQPDFTLSASATTLSLSTGQVAQTEVSVVPTNGFDSAVNVTVSGLPTGVTASPASFSVTSGSQQTLTLSAAPSATSATANLTLTGVSGTLSHALPLSLTVKSVPIPSLTRTKYLRTDSVTNYGAFLSENWVVYDPVTGRFFVSDPAGNQIVVLDAKTETQLGRIGVPGAFGLDETADHKTIYAGTQVGDIYTIDPVGMTVTKVYKAANIGPYGFQAYAVRVLANGELALLGDQENTIIYNGYGSVGVWNPSTNAFVEYDTEGNPSNPLSIPFAALLDMGYFTLTGDRSSIVVAGLDSGGPICTVQPVANTQTCANLPNAPYADYAFNLIATPDGNSILIPDGSFSSPQITVFDAHTLAKTSVFPVQADAGRANQLAVSPDSKTLYIASGWFLYAYDLATGQLSGRAPNLYLPSAENGLPTPYIQAFDNTGLLIGPMEEGVGFLDTTALLTTSIGTYFAGSYLNPATGPVGGGTLTQWATSAVSPSGVMAPSAAMYFGSNLAADTSGSGGEFSAILPPGAPGPVDVFTFLQDGAEQILPEAFSYGPTLLEATPNAATAEGGGTGYLYGYGLGAATGTDIPSNLQITIGGKQATIASFNANAYGLTAPPFPLQVISYSVPAGTVGAADIVVTTASGSVTLPSGFQYLPAIQQFPLSGAQLAQGIYDSKRDLYYFTDASQIRVFSLAQSMWLSSIPVPSPPSGSTHRLWGIALSPDGNTLAVSDSGAGLLYALDPDTPNSVTTIAVPQGPDSIQFLPCGIAVSDAGVIYFATYSPNSTGSSAFHKAVIATGAVTDYEIASAGYFAKEAQFRTSISIDGTQVYLNDFGTLISIDTATDAVSANNTFLADASANYDFALAGGGTEIDSSGYLYAPDLSGDTYISQNDREALNITYVYGSKMSPDGRLVFDPSTQGIDIYDGQIGNLRMRISLPLTLSANYDALVSDGKDNRLLAITGQSGDGIALIDLTSVPEPAPLQYLHRRARSVTTPVQAALDGRTSRIHPTQQRQTSASIFARKFATNPIPLQDQKRKQ